MAPKYLVVTILSLFLITSCGKSTQDSAQESLIGEWSISNIIETHTLMDNGVQLDQETKTFQDSNGKFIFTLQTMEYEYQTDSLISNQQNYILEITKENSGFIQVKVFTINGDEEDFRVRFGDQTNDAHKNANQISLEQSMVSGTITITKFVELTRTK